MKNVKYISFAAIMLFFAPAALNAQIENEIKSFVDSTEMMVINGRKMLTRHIQEGDYNKIAEIYDYLTGLTSEDDCEAFSYNEKMLIDLLLGDWNGFLTKAEHLTDKKLPMCYYTHDHVASALYDKVKSEYAILAVETQNSNLSDEDKALLDLFLYAVENDNNQEYEAKLKDFKKKYPQTLYKDFVRYYLPQPEFSAAIPISLGAAEIFPTGNLGAYFKPATGFSIAIDYYVNKVFVGFQVTGGKMKLRTDLLSDKTGYPVDFYANDKFSYYDGGLLAGYNILKTKSLHIAPYIYLGGSSLMSDLYEKSEDDDLEYHIFDSFFFGPGLRSEWKIVDFGKENTSMGRAGNYLSLRFDAGYNFPVKFDFKPARGGVFYTRLSLVWWIGYY
ncbi:MAG: hypothetical protein LBR64_11105 [Dysgonamonadaceae bacterium]|jgi:hypothetical protein|nr:hypothetical protein [Dysgonamonadaceae bacterium]